MESRLVRRHPRAALRLLSALAPLVVASGCLGSTVPEERPSTAHIRVDGTTPSPLELIVSTRFYEVQDATTLETQQVIEIADTTLITLPYDEVVSISSTGSVLVNLANHDTIPADVRLRVDLDTGQAPYDRSATMSEGGALRYVFLFLAVVI